MWGWVGGVVAAGAVAMSAAAAARYLVVGRMRVNATTAAYLLAELTGPAARVWRWSDEYVTDGAVPGTGVYLAWPPGAGPVAVRNSERLMQAGFAGKEVLCEVHYPRWRRSAVRRWLDGVDGRRRHGERVTVEAVTAYGFEPLGYLRPEMVQPPYQPEALWRAAAADVARCAAGGLDRTGLLLHGRPGTGKTSFVRWLAATHRLPVKVFTFCPDMTHTQVLQRFARLPDRCLVLFEDFDAVFDGRTPRSEAPYKFTFDALLNGLDGVFGVGRGVVFVLTANDLDRVDPALRERPSRFRHVLRFDEPAYATRLALLGSAAAAERTAGLTIDQVLHAAEAGVAPPTA